MNNLRNNPFKVPDQYFDSAKTKILNQTVQSHNKRKHQIKVWQMTIAATLILFSVGTYYFWNAYQENKKQEELAVVNEILFETFIQEDTYIESPSVLEEYSQILASEEQYAPLNQSVHEDSVQQIY